MDVLFHGAAKEVGRSCIEVITAGKDRYLLDAGIKFGDKGTELPSQVNDPAGIKAAFISHAHLDHTGYLPTLDAWGMRCPIFATAATKAAARMLLKDAYKIGRLKHDHLSYREDNIARSMSWMKKIRLDAQGSAGGIDFELIGAGHIPGSASVIMETKEKEKKRLFYTGDINTLQTRLLKGAEISSKDLGEIDLLITEATYGDRDHPDREKQEKDFISSIKATVDKGGSAVIPVFAEGRAQEIMLMLNKVKFGVPVHIDGMAVEATRLIQEHPGSIRDAKALDSAFSRLNQVKGRIQREKIAKEQGIFITTSGMLTGGPVMTYLKELCHDSRNSIFLTGYQAEHTNGRLLLEKGLLFIDGWKTKVNSQVKQYDFSAHSGRAELKAMIKKIDPQAIAVQHGDEGACLAIEEWADAMGYRAYVPSMGERIRI